jgi:hypothetical protein
MWYIQYEEMVIRSGIRRSLLHILLVVLVFLGAGSLYAAGKPEQDPLQEAREAYESRDYNRAILLSTEVMKKYPEYFDEAQSLIRAIRGAKIRYNNTFADLIELYQDALENQDDAGLSESYTIIKELEELDPYPNEETAESLARAREATGNVYNRIRHAKIMDQGLEQIQAGAFFEAVETYREGFNLALDIFRDKDYGKDPESEAEGLREQAAQLGEEFIEYRDSLTETGRYLEQIRPDSSLEQLRSAAESLTSEYQDLSDLRWRIQGVTQSLEVLRLLILNEYAAEAEDEIYHLAYLILLHRGRSSVEEDLGVDEGILGAVDERWNEGAEPVADAFRDLLTRLNEEAHTLYSQRRYIEAIEVFERMTAVADVAAEAAGIWRYQIAPAPEPGTPDPDYRLLIESEKAPDYLKSYYDLGSYVRIIKGNASDSIELARLGTLILEQAEFLSGTQSLDLETVLNSRDLLDERALILDPLTVVLQERRGIPMLEEDYRQISRNRLREHEQRISMLDDLYRNSNEEFMLIYIRRRQNDFTTRLTALQELDSSGNSALEGEVILFQGDSFTARYPDRALELYSQLTEDAEVLLEENQALFTELNELPQWLRSRESIAAGINSVAERSETINGLLTRTEQRSGEAVDLIRIARQNRLDGERRYMEAESRVRNRQFNVNNPNAVENGISDARDYFLASLQQQYDPLLDRRTDAVPDNSDNYDIQSLLSELAQAKRNYYLPQREAALAEARHLIRQQDFEQAGIVLNRAEDYHRQLDSEDYPEIVRLQEFVDRAINTSSAWYISKNDPLYAEMSQLLNLARSDYRAALERVETGQNTGIKVLLESAEEKLAAVQNTFPQNLEVGILQLQIEMLRTANPAEQNRIIAEKFDQAQRTFNAGDYQRSLALAKALQAIRSGYPGLEDLIVEGEIATGQRVREPDPADVRAANALYADANSIWQNRIQDQYPAALESIQRAIARYTPFNPPARYLELKQQLEIRVDTSTAAILSAADQLQYQSALEAYQQGNFVQAKLIVDQLIQKGENARNPRLMDLKRRIESRL